VLVNTGTAAAQAHLKFFDDNGNPLTLPLAFPQSGANSPSAQVDQSIAANASLVIQSAGQSASPVLIGSIQLATDGKVGGYVIFRYEPKGQEASTPFENRGGTSYLIPFDHTAGIVTGTAVNNASPKSVTIPVVLRDDRGAQIGTGSIALSANGHSAFLLADQFPVTANIRGSIEFDTPPGAQISILGVRTTPSLTFTTLPPLAKTP
jgi:hypothetical protein